MRRKSLVRDSISIAMLIICMFVIWAVLNTASLGTSFVFIRKYLSPLVLGYTIIYEKAIDENCYVSMTKYILNLLSVLCAWGIFQAYILGPEFLIKLGYPTKYSFAYRAITLKDSFYFGNLGIQRVVSTLSNANVFALILGSAIIVILINYRKVLLKWIDWIKLLVIMLAYVLTFSRANFLGIIIIGLVIIWKYIPKKEYIFLLFGVVCIGFMALYLYQDDNGITHKLVGWVVSSLTFTESSAAGRSGIWKEGFRAVLDNPLGIGFGKVGSWAATAGVEKGYSCESSYLAMGLDFGWAGVICYVGFLIILIRQAYIYRETDDVKGRSVGAVLMYLMIAFAFSNHIYDREAVMLIYLLVGFTLNCLRCEKARYITEI